MTRRGREGIPTGVSLTPAAAIWREGGSTGPRLRCPRRDLAHRRDTSGTRIFQAIAAAVVFPLRSTVSRRQGARRALCAEGESNRHEGGLSRPRRVVVGSPFEAEVDRTLHRGPDSRIHLEQLRA